MKPTFSTESAANKDLAPERDFIEDKLPAKVPRTYVKFLINQIQPVSGGTSVPSPLLIGPDDPIGQQMRRPKSGKSAKR